MAEPFLQCALSPYRSLKNEGVGMYMRPGGMLGGGGGRPPWRVYFKDDHVVVTSWYVQIGGRRIPIADLVEPVQVMPEDGQHNVRIRFLEIQATVHGETVVIYQTGNEQRFGQVRRALIRALEANR